MNIIRAKKKDVVPFSALCAYRHTFIFFLCTFCLSVSAQNTPAFSHKPTRVLFLLDASGSMKGTWQNTDKISAAKQILFQIADTLEKQHVEYALRIFGHQSERYLADCKDTKLEMPFAKNNYSKLQNILNEITPKGYSPIALSLEQAINDFSFGKSNINNNIILITDGFENCEGDACAAVQKLQTAGISFRPYIIGLGLSDEEKVKFDCIGELYNVKDNTVISNASEIAINYLLNPTTLQINLLDEVEKPTETNVNMTFFDANTKEIKYNIYHTINANGNPDTLIVDASKTYRIKIHTLPPKFLKYVNLRPGKHTTKAVDVPQGSLRINITGSVKYTNLKCIVETDRETLNIQDVNTTQKYASGDYNLKILTLPPIYINNVEIRQHQEQLINIPTPGILNISKTTAGHLFIFRKESEQLTNVYTMDVETLKETLRIQPGEYEILYRTKDAKNTSTSFVKKVTVISGSSVSVNF